MGLNSPNSKNITPVFTEPKSLSKKNFTTKIITDSLKSHLNDDNNKESKIDKNNISSENNLNIPYPIYPNEKLSLETNPQEYTMRLMDLLSPIVMYLQFLTKHTLLYMIP